MLRKRTRSVQKDQHQMGHHNHHHHQQTVSGSGSESFFQSDVGNKNPKNNSFYTNIPGLLVGLSTKGLALTDCDSVRSPTSPLDFRLFSGLGNPFRSSSTRSSSHEHGQQRSWVGGGGSSKLGLISIIDSVDDDMKFSGKVLRSSSESSKNILFGPKLRINKAQDGHQQETTNSFESPKSLPKNYAIFPHSSKPKSPLQKDSSDVLFEIGDSPLEPDSFGKIRSCSLDSCRTIPNLFWTSATMKFSLENNSLTTQVSSPRQLFGGSPSSKNQLSGTKNLISKTPGSISGSCGNGFGIESFSASEIELSEDYTCVISHGPNPKTIHIFGDCILETHSNDLVSNFGNSGLSHPTINITNPNSEISVPYPSDGFLSFCYSCNKKLEDGKDIYIYRGEKAFCSLNCRSLEILIDEELEKCSDKDSENAISPDDDHDVADDNHNDDDGKLFFETGLIVTT